MVAPGHGLLSKHNYAMIKRHLVTQRCLIVTERLCHVCSETKKRWNEIFPFHFHFLNFRIKTCFYEMPWKAWTCYYLFLGSSVIPISWWGRPPHWFLRRICYIFPRNETSQCDLTCLKACYKHVPSLKQNSCPEIETCKIYKHWWYSLTPVMQYLSDDICSKASQLALLKIPGEIKSSELPLWYHNGNFTVYLFLFLCVSIYNNLRNVSEVESGL